MFSSSAGRGSAARIVSHLYISMNYQTGEGHLKQDGGVRVERERVCVRWEGYHS